MIDLAIRDARIYTDSGVVAGDVLIDDGRITALTTRRGELDARTTIDAAGALLLPGGVDLHVHFRDPGFTEKEDFVTGSQAAALGGITSVLDMPNTDPAVMDAGTLRAKRDGIAGRSYVDFGLIAAVDASNVDQIRGLADAGAAAFKLFLYQRKDAPPAGVTDDAVIVRIMEEVATTGLRVHVHAENDDLIRAGIEARRDLDGLAWIDHLAARRDLAEAEAIERAILFAAASETRLHVCHLSSAAGVALVARAKREGLPVTAEVTPQHLLLDSTAYDEKGPDLVMVPPVRAPADRIALAEGLIDGTIDVIATDHAPHRDADKAGRPLAISTGLVGVQWSYQLLLTEAFAGRLPLRRVVDAMSTRPARMLGLESQKGVIRPGADADLVLVEQTATMLNRGDLVSKGTSTPFDGTEAGCRIVTTVVGGSVQVQDGRLTGEPTGAFITPKRERNPEIA